MNWIIYHFVAFIGDMFLVYLLYKFSRPQEKRQDGRTAASAALFAHKPSPTSEDIEHHAGTMSEQGKGEEAQKQQKKLIDYLTDQWAEDFGQQMEIGYGFVEQESKMSEYQIEQEYDEGNEVILGYDKKIEDSLLQD